MSIISAKLITTFILCGLSGWLYRAGGQGKPYNTRYRDIGVSIVTLLVCLTWGLVGALWATLGAYVLTFGLSWGALSAYWGQDEKKWGFWAHGLGLSLALLPIAILTQHFLGFAIRCLVLTAAISVWSEINGDVNWEEMGRGILVVLSLLILLL